MIIKNINDVAPNDVLGEDVYHDHLLLIKNGTKLSKQMITQLKKRKIKEVKITVEASQQKHSTQAYDEISELIEAKMPVTDIYLENKTRDTFFQALTLVGYEYRYGKILNNDKDVQFLIHLFTDMHKNYHFMDTLYALRSWNHYNFIHSFDVFILGTLVAKKLDMYHLESIALGFLFHDIGHMKIPQDILLKKGKLSFDEFELVKKHTIEGEKILNSLGQKEIAHFARSHHERMDGSGYPDNLARMALSKELSILQIIDVYSALTLKRPYKNALPATEALRILIQDVNRYDESVLYCFIDALAIYPSHSTVLLSDHTAATIQQVSKHAPTLPDIKRLDQDETATLPLDFSVTISKIIHFQSKTFQARFKEFLNYLMEGNKEASNDTFSYLVDGLKLEEIYTKIFLPAFWNTVKLVKERKLTEIEYDKSHSGLKDLLEQLEQEMTQLNHYKFNTLFIIEENATYTDTVLLKIALGLLHIEYIFPIVINYPISEDDLKWYVIENNVKSICVINLDDTTKQNYNHLQSKEMKISYKSYNEINRICLDITTVQNQSFKLYERLFDLSCMTLT